MDLLIVLALILMLFTFLAVVVLAILFIAIPIMIAPNHHRDVSKFFGRLYAHRGLHDNEVPENSITAFKLAKENGYGAELDVQMTSDGKLVVFHDSTLTRMCGVDLRIKDCTYEELLKYRLKDSDEQIPLLSEALKALGHADLICEIKGDNGVRNYELCQKVYDELRHYEGEYCIESFSPYLVKWFKKNHPEIIRGQLSQRFTKEDKLPFMARITMNNLLVNCLSRPDFIAFRFQDIRQFGFRLCKSIYRPFLVAWTAKGEEEQKKAWETFDSVIFEKLPRY